MTTEGKYKKYLLADCDKRQIKEEKLECIQRNVHFEIGEANYVNYRAKMS